MSDPGRFADLVAGYLELKTPERQALLETLSVEDRLRRILVQVQRQIAVADAQEDIKSQVQEEIGERQREMYLREQLKAIRRELGDGNEDDDVAALREKLEKLELPEAAEKEVERELNRLERAAKESMEAQVIRTFLEWIAELPWNTRSEDLLDTARAHQVLEEDHYGLKDVKERVLEFLAVRQLRERESEPAAPAAAGAEPHGPGGRPGPAARPDPALRRAARHRQDVDREVHRPRDGAQVRAHLARRGARRGRHPRPPAHVRRRAARAHHPGDEAGRHEEPGLPPRRGGQARRVVPGRPRRGAPRGARPGAERQLHGSLPRRAVRPVRGALHRHGELPAEHPGAAARPDGDRRVHRLHGAREARHRAAVPGAAAAPRERPLGGRADRSRTRPSARSSAATRTRPACGSSSASWAAWRGRWRAASRRATRRRSSWTATLAKKELGRPKVRPERASREDAVGVATGMYYTPSGGDIMFVEAALMPGKEELVLTGQLGDVMKESARAALSYAKKNAAALGVPEQALQGPRAPHPRAGRAPSRRTGRPPASRWRPRWSARSPAGRRATTWR